MRQKESDFQSKEEQIRKNEETKFEDLKKTLESKMKQLNFDLNKQIANNKSLRSDHEALTNRCKQVEEKYAHCERDCAQKKQLIENYKKKLQDFSEKEKSELILKSQQEPAETVTKIKLKKLNDLNQKYLMEINQFKMKLKLIETEKQKN